MDEVLKCIIDALEEKNYTAIRNLGTYFGRYATKFHAPNTILFMEDKRWIPAQLRALFMARLHRCHAGLFTMRDIAKSYCEESINSGKN